MHYRHPLNFAVLIFAVLNISVYDQPQTPCMDVPSFISSIVSVQQFYHKNGFNATYINYKKHNVNIVNFQISNLILAAGAGFGLYQNFRGFDVRGVLFVCINREI